MNPGVFITLIIIGVVWGEVLSCDSCGRECAAACGTRQFRACCFNYLRKRTSPLQQLSVDPSLRLQLWLARSRAVRTPQAPEYLHQHVSHPDNPSNTRTSLEDNINYTDLQATK